MGFCRFRRASAQAPSVRMCLSLPNTATPVQTQRVWRLLASTSRSFPAQLWATWPRTSRLESGPSPGWMCGSVQIASVSTLSLGSFSPSRCGGAAVTVRAEAAHGQGFWGPTYSSAPPSLPSCTHRHTYTYAEPCAFPGFVSTSRK